MVFNHTAEGDQTGTTLNYRGLANAIYYLLDPDDRSRYLDYSGCGNTLNCGHPVVRDHVLDCLRFWTAEMHVDGFRFDLASRLCGSADIYQQTGKPPCHSVNFVTCHDGFTLNDLVSYGDKHNQVNGEDNRDGTDANFSANYGVEGATEDPAIEAVRVRQIKNLLATLMLSRGVPLLLGGDEFRRSQAGNNNAYCQDNPLSWYDWTLLDAHREVFDFVAHMIRFRKRHPVLRAALFYTHRELIWFDTGGRRPDWERTRALGCLVQGSDGRGLLCLLFNPEDSEAAFRLPAAHAHERWRLEITADDAAAADRELRGDGDTWLMGSRSLKVLVCTRELEP